MDKDIVEPTPLKDKPVTREDLIQPSVPTTAETLGTKMMDQVASDPDALSAVAKETFSRYLNLERTCFQQQNELRKFDQLKGYCKSKFGGVTKEQGLALMAIAGQTVLTIAGVVINDLRRENPAPELIIWHMIIIAGFAIAAGVGIYQIMNRDNEKTRRQISTITGEPGE